MNLEYIVQLYMPIVMTACLVIGFIIKKWVKDVENKWIPTICCLLGAALACGVNHEINIQTLIAGAVTGLASTGLHQAFKQMIEGGQNGSH